MSNDEPTPDVDPAAAADVATGAADDVDMDDLADAPTDPGAGGSGHGSRVLDGLTETNPAGEPGDYPGIPEWAGYAIVGSIKFLNGATDDDMSMGSGRPAFMDFVLAGVTFGTGDGGGDTPSPESTDDAPSMGHPGGGDRE